MSCDFGTWCRVFCIACVLQDNLDYLQWQEPRLLLECLLNYFNHHPNEIELLFHMLRCFTSRYIPQFHFFKEFLENEIAEVRIWCLCVCACVNVYVLGYWQGFVQGILS